MTKLSSDTARLLVVADFAGKLAGMDSAHFCDLSGTVPGRLTGTDIIDYLSAELGTSIEEEFRSAVLLSYTYAYNRAVKEGKAGGGAKTS